jgi:hypothetical protein
MRLRRLRNIKLIRVKPSILKSVPVSLPWPAGGSMACHSLHSALIHVKPNTQKLVAVSLPWPGRQS